MVPSEDAHLCRAHSTRASDRADSGVRDVPPGARPELRYSGTFVKLILHCIKPSAYDVNTLSVQYDVIRAIESEASSSMGHYHDMTPAQHQSTLQKIVDMCWRFRRAASCREDDTLLLPRTSGSVPRAGPSSRRSAPEAQSGPPPPPPVTMATPSASAARPTYVPRPAHLYSAGKSYSNLVSPTIPHHVKLYSSTCTSYSCSARLIVVSADRSVRRRIFLPSSSNTRFRYI